MIDLVSIYGPVLDGVVNGFLRTFSYPTILFALAGTLFGLVLGAIPGMGGSTGMILALPLAITMEPNQAMIFLSSILGGTTQGGAVTAILLNAPGKIESAMTAMDGFALTKQGRGSEAVSLSALASGSGAIFGIGVMILSIPLLEEIALAFGSVEKFLLVFFGITAIATASRGSLTTGLVSGFVGMTVGYIGLSPTTGIPRYTFGTGVLHNGVNFIPVLIGVFIISQMISLGASQSAIADTAKSIGLKQGGFSFGEILRSFKHLRTNFWLFLRCSIIGTVIGMIPGAGGSVATPIAYGHAIQTADNPEKFGSGDVRGILAPEASNDAKDGGQLMPTLALGIPGSASMVVLLGIFLIFGINPGPNIIQEHLDLVFSIIAAVLVSNVLSSVIVLVAANRLTLITQLDPSYFVPIIIAASAAGAYAANKDPVNIPVMIFFGLVGYVMRKYNYSPITFLLGLILAPLAEMEFFKALQFAAGDPSFFVTPISIILTLGIIISIFAELRNN